MAKDTRHVCCLLLVVYCQYSSDKQMGIHWPDLYLQIPHFVESHRCGEDHVQGSLAHQQPKVGSLWLFHLASSTRQIDRGPTMSWHVPCNKDMISIWPVVCTTNLIDRNQPTSNEPDMQMLTNICLKWLTLPNICSMDVKYLRFGPHIPTLLYVMYAYVWVARNGAASPHTCSCNSYSNTVSLSNLKNHIVFPSYDLPALLCQPAHPYHTIPMRILCPRCSSCKTLVQCLRLAWIYPGT